MQHFAYSFRFVLPFDCPRHNFVTYVHILRQPVSEVEEKLGYVNKERDKGAVSVSVPPDFKDLSKEHEPLGCLCEEIKVKWVRGKINQQLELQ